MKGTPSILLVDDNRAWRDTLADLLRDMGFAVSAAEGPTAGQVLLDDEDFLAAVIDYQMPDMDGLQWLPSLRERLPVLMLSSADDPGVVEQALEEGALAFLSKCQPPRELLPKLRRMMLLAVVVAIARRVLAGENNERPPLPPPSHAA